MKNKVLTICAAILFFSGCASNDNQYYWGEYENLVYKSHHTPGEVPPSLQIAQLQTDIAKAAVAGKPIPPGVYAHLGLMYAANGNKELALASLIKEKELFPESSRFIDGLIKRSLTNS
mgnify:FL=1|tara:strand:+ start:216 stop:569 length:354 start_codon:yes stop_codon:yes gene_type:complete